MFTISFPQILTALLTTTILSLQTTSHPTAATQDPDNTGIIAGPMGAAALLPPPTPVWADFFRVIGYQSIGCSRGQKDSLLDADPAAKQGKVNQCVDLPKPANSHRIHFYGPNPKKATYQAYYTPCSSHSTNTTGFTSEKYHLFTLNDTVCYTHQLMHGPVMSFCYGDDCIKPTEGPGEANARSGIGAGLGNEGDQNGALVLPDFVGDGKPWQWVP